MARSICPFGQVRKGLAVDIDENPAAGEGITRELIAHAWVCIGGDENACPAEEEHLHVCVVEAKDKYGCSRSKQMVEKDTVAKGLACSSPFSKDWPVTPLGLADARLSREKVLRRLGVVGLCVFNKLDVVVSENDVALSGSSKEAASQLGVFLEINVTWISLNSHSNGFSHPLRGLYHVAAVQEIVGRRAPTPKPLPQLELGLIFWALDVHEI